jgi:hypothetical protein
MGVARGGTDVGVAGVTSWHDINRKNNATQAKDGFDELFDMMNSLPEARCNKLIGCA